LIHVFIMITVIYLARFAEELGLPQEQLSPNFTDSDALLAYLRQRGAPFSEVLAAGKVYKIAVNNIIQHGCAALKDGDSIALLPPVTGG
jgi:sulfur-carrier protein